MDQQTRPDGEQAARDLGFLLHDRADLERRVADGERVAHLDVEPRREARVGPGLAARWNALRVGDPPSFAGSTSVDRPAQRIAGAPPP